MKRASSGAFPPVPSQITIPVYAVTVAQTGETQIPASTPFYYAAISAIWVHFRVDPKVAQALLPPGLEVAVFDGAALASVHFMNALAQYGIGSPGNATTLPSPGGSVFNETEINIVALPSARAAVAPTLTADQFLAGGDQTKLLGNFRVWVACDDAVAVAAGKALYFENKILTSYGFNIPAMNNAGQSEYSWTCFENLTTTEVYSAKVDLAGLAALPANVSEWIDYSFDAEAQRPVASRRNYFGIFSSYDISNAQSAVAIAWGTSTLQMLKDMQALFGTASPIAVQTFASPTVIAEAGPYYADV